MININLSGVRNTFGSFSLFNFNFINSNGEKHKKEVQKNEKIDFGKNHIISIYSRFCSLPDFQVENPTMNKILVHSFYNVAIKLTKDLDLTDSQFNYYKKNFLAKNVRDKSDLIEYLINEKLRINKNDSRYYLGFRSIYFILNQNINIINYKYLSEINKMLTPFFISFKHKELLIFGLPYIEK